LSLWIQHHIKSISASVVPLEANTTFLPQQSDKTRFIMYWGKRNLRLGKNELGVSSKEVKTRSKRMEQTIKGTLRGSY
jgi:hypothetical protein